MAKKVLILFLFWCSKGFAQNAKFVNVFIGTDGTGHTFPGPSMPFGMVQPGPDNRNFGWDHTSGYQYKDTLLLGFSQTRFSGTGISEMGDVLLLPFFLNIH
jgi:putative alpha-1,2-mannosidase